MKSCLGLLITLFIFVSVIGGGALIWYLSTTAEFTRTDHAAAGSAKKSTAPPVAIPVREAAPARNKPPVAIPVR